MKNFYKISSKLVDVEENAIAQRRKNFQGIDLKVDKAGVSVRLGKIRTKW